MTRCEYSEDIITHVTISSETNDQHGASEGQHPGVGGGIGRSNHTVLPDIVDGSKGTDGVRDIIGTMGERIDTGSHYLEERVQVLGLVVVNFRVLPHALLAVGLFARTGLHLVNVDAGPVREDLDESSAVHHVVLGFPPHSLDLVLVVGFEHGEGHLGLGIVTEFGGGRTTFEISAFFGVFAGCVSA